MNPLLPKVKAKDLVRVAKKLGFELDRQIRKSRHFLSFFRQNTVVIPMHAGRDIKAKTLHGIIDDMQITPEQFKKLL
jgi:predicted RNA binding protein YcfA (HicA-like mRNA interferase family)